VEGVARTDPLRYLLLPVSSFRRIALLTLMTAIAAKRHGWVTNEDKLEAIMEGAPPAASAVDWGPPEYS
jgi:hypothetical protein